MISEDVIEKVKELNDIVEVVSETTKLKRSGRYYLGLCPFHSEKTPSFTVTPDKQIYKCFGCGEAGNVITFVMKIKNVPFLDAVQILADRANIDISYEKNNKQVHINEKLYKINVEAARYYFYNLRNNKMALSYLQNRGLKQKTITTFGLGYAYDRWDGLLKYLKSKGYTNLEMLKAGLIIKSKKESFYDRFRNRIIFPLFNYRGKVIGFGGRVLDDSKPKYLNSPETNIFKKGINLYGLNFAIKNRNRLDETFIIVEGYMDCISLHQQGINMAVASLGTALTENQAKLLKRYGNKIIIAYDGDLAGQKATMRGLDILKNEGFEVRVLSIPEGKDPDEFISTYGKKAFLDLTYNSMELIEYKIKKVTEDINLANTQNMVQYAEKAMKIIQNLNPVEKGIYIKKISNKTSISEQSLYELINQKIQKTIHSNNNMNINDKIGNKLYVEPIYVKTERKLLKLICSNKKALQYISKVLPQDSFIFEPHKKIYQIIIENDNSDIRKIIENKYADSDLIKEWVNIMETNFITNNCDYKCLINDFIKEIKKFKLEENRKQIMIKIKEYESKGEIEKSLELAQKLVKIKKQLANI